MLARALAVVKSKVALAVLGAIVLTGGGGAVALAASHGHGVGLGLSSGWGGAHGASSGQGQNHPHAEGTLTACDATAGTISVTDAQGAVHVFQVSATTRFNGDIHGSSAHGSSSAHGAAAFGLKDLCALVNHVKVQVQGTATPAGSTMTATATKVTVQGADGASDTSPEPTEAPERTPDAQS